MKGILLVALMRVSLGGLVPTDVNPSGFLPEPTFVFAVRFERVKFGSHSLADLLP